MSKILGIDVGTNSIGWCLIKEGKNIIDAGVRIFPVGVKEDDYNKSGSEKSKNATRRDARHARRTYDRYRQRRNRLEKQLTEIGFMFDKTESVPAKELYGYRSEGLDSKLEREQFGRILFLLNQRRGFKSNRKGTGKDDDKGLKGEMNAFAKMLAENNYRTPGEFFASLFDAQPANWHNENEPTQRIRKTFRVRRELYEKEFDQLWEQQAKYYPELTEDRRKRIKENVIFYQRKLKSAKHLVSKCRFEPAKRVIPKSHPLFQQFRVWQTVNIIRVTDKDRVLDYLTHQERTDLAAELMCREKMSHSQIKKFLGWSSKAEMNDLPQFVLGNVTESRIATALGERDYGRLSKDEKERLWHHLYFAQDEEWLINVLDTSWNFSNEQIDALIEVNLEADYGSVSQKFIKAILPHLEDGFDYAAACEKAGYHHSFDQETEGKDRVVQDRIDTASQEPLRNPLVQMSVNETSRLVNAIIEKYGKPDRVRIELLRSLKLPKDKREQQTNKNKEKQRQRDDFKEFLKNKGLLKDPKRSDLIKFELWLELEHSTNDLERLAPELNLEDFQKFRSRVNSKDQQKYRLWLECGRISPYTGNPIPLSKLFSEEIEVEHILPFSRSLDDSFVNKTLCESSFNAAKGNLTPLEFFRDRPVELRSFKERVKAFGTGKQEKFLTEQIDSEFKNNQLTNTAYIGKEVRRIMRTICSDVRVSSGAVTSLLRRQWGLNKLIWDGTGDKKNRDDHRHHAIDALVIACTNDGVINEISRLAQTTPYGEVQLKGLQQPWNTFQQDAAQQVGTMLISYKGGKRLISSRTNLYRHSKAHQSKKAEKVRNVSVRGALHEETFYGQIMHPEKQKLVYVVRKDITVLAEKDLSSIIDAGVRKSVEHHVTQHGGQWAAAMKEPVFMLSKKGVQVPIKTVRVDVAVEGLIPLKYKDKVDHKKLYVKPGNNFCIAIYEDAAGKRDMEVVNFFTAVENSVSGKMIYPSSKNGKPLKMTLQQRDLVVLYDQHPDEIDWKNKRDLFSRLYMVRKFDKNGRVGLIRHHRTNLNPSNPDKNNPTDAFIFRALSGNAIKVAVNDLGHLVRL